jgi:hypothetical protein
MVWSFWGYGWWGLGGETLPHFLSISNSFSCIELPKPFDFYFPVEKKQGLEGGSVRGYLQSGATGHIWLNSKQY